MASCSTMTPRPSSRLCPLTQRPPITETPGCRSPGHAQINARISSWVTSDTSLVQSSFSSTGTISSLPSNFLIIASAAWDSVLFNAPSCRGWVLCVTARLARYSRDGAVFDVFLKYFSSYCLYRDFQPKKQKSYARRRRRHAPDTPHGFDLLVERQTNGGTSPPRLIEHWKKRCPHCGSPPGVLIRPQLLHIRMPGATSSNPSRIRL